MKPGRRRSWVYGVERADVQAFVNGNVLVQDYLGKFGVDGNGLDEDVVRQSIACNGKFLCFKSTGYDYARYLCMFFKWLRLVESVGLGPEQFLNGHLKRKNSQSFVERKWALRYVLRFTRDNPDFAGSADGYKIRMFMAIKQFFDYHEAPLVSGNGYWGKRQKRKFHPKQMDIALAKKVLGVLNQRDRTICLMMLQSGQNIEPILNHVNGMYDYLKGCVDRGEERIKLEFYGRKGNNLEYVTFISTDAIHELKKWFGIRKIWLEKLPSNKKRSDAIFITRNGKTYTPNKFESNFTRTMMNSKLRTMPYGLVSHMFRKLFKSESSPPERGISPEYIEYMLGHAGGIESVGGIYDKAPEIHPEVVEKEYRKIEPYLNIYTGKTVRSEISDDERKVLELLREPRMLQRLKELIGEK